jgi:hypothetical protein
MGKIKFESPKIRFVHESEEQSLDLREVLQAFSDANMRDSNNARCYRKRIVESLLFDLAHHALAEQGCCDSSYATEYQRVREEWFEADCPDDVETFIVEHSNEIRALSISAQRARAGSMLAG